ncbi:2-oxo-4-hydroxy-4-carboxy-5-ureidoimidazoline decarboxylase [Arenimonas sp.]|uniref:2-oxo-4-hydroxy-4-carboxy-5-ureidoimidazoline decarboxylase n=1 Tax=Arenimonas sp. TaxID=1872635 RepID=UPI0039E34FA3
MTLGELNRMDRAAFRTALGAIFEHSPWVAERAWDARPFADTDALHAAMCAVVADSDKQAQMTLIRAHPRLADRAALRAGLSADSQREQIGAGLDQCSADELADLTALNAAYDERFGFPFIIAVREHTRAGIIEQMRNRLGRAPETEVAEALRQIERIARLRLDALVEH